MAYILVVSYIIFKSVALHQEMGPVVHSSPEKGKNRPHSTNCLALGLSDSENSMTED